MPLEMSVNPEFNCFCLGRQAHLAPLATAAYISDASKPSVASSVVSSGPGRHVLTVTIECDNGWQQCRVGDVERRASDWKSSIEVIVRLACKKHANIALLNSLESVRCVRIGLRGIVNRSDPALPSVLSTNLALAHE